MTTNSYTNVEIATLVAVYSLQMLASLLLMATFCVYVAVAELRRNVHGRAVMCYAVSLAAAEIASAVNGIRSLVASYDWCSWVRTSTLKKH